MQGADRTADASGPRCKDAVGRGAETGLTIGGGVARMAGKTPPRPIRLDP